jgi:hypothetical protein
MISAMMSGVMLTLALIAALLFFRAYRRTRDRLFILFGAAFIVLAAERLFLGVTPRAELSAPFAFVPRIIAFAIIIFAIVDRNRR